MAEELVDGAYYWVLIRLSPTECDWYPMIWWSDSREFHMDEHSWGLHEIEAVGPRLVPPAVPSEEK